MAGVDTMDSVEPDGLEVRAAAAIGALTATAGGAQAAERFLRGVLRALWASGGYLLVRHGKRRAAAFQGLDSDCLGPACREPEELIAAAGEASVWRCGEAGRSALLDTDYERAVLGVPPRPLLRVHARDLEDDGELVLVALRTVEAPGFSDSLARVASVLEPVLARAAAALVGGAPAQDEPGRMAWTRCNVPLIWVHSDGTVVASNPSAVRKLGLAGHEGPLPDWLEVRLRERLDALARDGGLPSGASGDYSWARVGSDRPLYRIGLAPVEAAAGSGRPMWLLSVEEGGPGLEHRLEQARERFELSAREVDVLRGVAAGLSNRQLARSLGVRETTVKFHLSSLLQKSGCVSRTDLLATFYSLDG